MREVAKSFKSRQAEEINEKQFERQKEEGEREREGGEREKKKEPQCRSVKRSSLYICKEIFLDSPNITTIDPS
ncbi:uncharacterized protein Dmoj_GI26962 [Drosophila mojavensis]|uniref:Uncharacterized protein n=1 Tax=Drosophila mojavensis TaxID=7230 RepID=A0A0Q9XN04_DROMO|nr:uncharacterized protein Dmoj_GI26962 [Drosophila mojavensis]